MPDKAGLCTQPEQWGSERSGYDGDSGRALMGGGLHVCADAIAFSKMIRDLIERALLPLFSLRQPENPALGIVSRTLPAHRFLTANRHELVHELHSSGVKLTSPHPSRVRARVSQFCSVKNGSNSVPAITDGIISQRNTFTTATPIIAQDTRSACHIPVARTTQGGVELKLQGSGERMPGPRTP
jgi:hypothetical protein